MLSAERFSAREAYRIGLLHELVVDAPALDEAIGELTAALLGNGPQALAECKRMIADYAGRALDEELLEDSAQRITRLRAGSEGREGMDAFLQRRPPGWVR
jgi:methylglutaconyl-CoA hydratase